MCRAKWDFSSAIRMGYRATAGHRNMDFGNVIHSGLEWFYHPGVFSDWDVRTNAALGAAIIENERQEQAALVLVPQGGDEEEAVRIDFKERKELVFGMFENYFEYARTNDRGKPLFVEQKFSVPIPGFKDVVYEGKVDVIWEADDGIWLWDHKTAAQLGDMPFLGPVELDSQIRSYCWAIRKALQVPIRGFVVNEIRKGFPSPPVVLKNGNLSKNKQQDTTYELFMKALLDRQMSTEGYEEYLAYLKLEQKQFVRRTTCFFSKADLDITEDLIVNEVFDMLGSFDGTPTYSLPSIYPNPSRGQCQGCEFRQPCIERFTGGDFEFLLKDQQRYRKEADDDNRIVDSEDSSRVANPTGF
jgi:hypothetical protein